VWRGVRTIYMYVDLKKVYVTMGNYYCITNNIMAAIQTFLITLIRGEK